MRFNKRRGIINDHSFSSFPEHALNSDDKASRASTTNFLSGHFKSELRDRTRENVNEMFRFAFLEREMMTSGLHQNRVCRNLQCFVEGFLGEILISFKVRRERGPIVPLVSIPHK
jgi:hypothetical protein